MSGLRDQIAAAIAERMQRPTHPQTPAQAAADAALAVMRRDLAAVLEAACYAGDDCPPLHDQREHPDWDGAHRRLSDAVREAGT